MAVELEVFARTHRQYDYLLNNLDDIYHAVGNAATALILDDTNAAGLALKTVEARLGALRGEVYDARTDFMQWTDADIFLAWLKAANEKP